MYSVIMKINGYKISDFSNAFTTLITRKVLLMTATNGLPRKVISYSVLSC